MSYVKNVENDSIIYQLKELIEDNPNILYVDVKSTAKGTSEYKSRKKFDKLYSDLTRWEKANLFLILQEINF